MKKIKLSWQMSPILLAALVVSIPAFYLVLNGEELPYRNAGHWLYGLVAITVGIDIFVTRSKPAWTDMAFKLDLLVLLGALASAWPTSYPWSEIEWLLRLAYCAVVFIRLSTLLAKYVALNHLLQIVTFAIAVLTIAGAGFYWLEPRVHTYADGVWLAFITAATVGYGDLVPSTPASRIFAVFIVLLGYALFSIVTASIAALLVGEDEKRIRRELHADMRLLRAEIALLRKELHESIPASKQKDVELP